MKDILRLSIIAFLLVTINSCKSKKGDLNEIVLVEQEFNGPYQFKVDNSLEITGEYLNELLANRERSIESLRCDFEYSEYSNMYRFNSNCFAEKLLLKPAFHGNEPEYSMLIEYIDNMETSSDFHLRGDFRGIEIFESLLDFSLNKMEIKSLSDDHMEHNSYLIYMKLFKMIAHVEGFDTMSDFGMYLSKNNSKYMQVPPLDCPDIHLCGDLKILKELLDSKKIKVKAFGTN